RLEPEEELLQRITQLSDSRKRPIIVVVSGFGGSGKSTLAEKLKEELGDAEIVSLDAFIVDQLQKRSEDWDGFDRERFRSQVLDPATRGETVEYEEYDWSTNKIAGWRSLSKSKYLIVEGCSLLHPDLLQF